MRGHPAGRYPRHAHLLGHGPADRREFCSMTPAQRHEKLEGKNQNPFVVDSHESDEVARDRRPCLESGTLKSSSQ